jgi:hypothetical protein
MAGDQKIEIAAASIALTSMLPPPAAIILPRTFVTK